MKRVGRLILAFSLCVCALFLISSPSLAAERQTPDELTNLPLEQLADVKVFSPSRREESVFGAAASVSVITSEDIHRSGAANIPEALRLVPGLNVTRVDSNFYEVTSRGMSDLPAANKLLVLVDGRAVYSPTNSLVWWQSVQYPLEDIDHIEVVLGPGSAVWGANANSGVVNIVTKNAEKTEGLLLSAGTGNIEKWSAVARYGGRVGNGSFRAYLSGDNTNLGRKLNDAFSLDVVDAGDFYDPHQNRQAGFRYDAETNRTRMTLHGDVFENYAGSEGANFVGWRLDAPLAFESIHYVYNNRFAGRNLLWRLEGDLDSPATASLQLYYDNTNTRLIYGDETLNTVDGEAQMEYRGLPGQILSAGLDYRWTQTNFTDTLAMQMPDSQLHLYGLFVQDEVRGYGERLKVTLGAKVEKNNFSGWEFQPTAKAAWVEDGWMAWASAARSVRLSNPVNNNLNWNLGSADANPNGLEGILTVKGSPDVQPEEVYAFEGGGRIKDENSTLSLSGFLNHYTNVLDSVSTGEWATLSGAGNPYNFPGAQYNVQYQQFMNVYEGNNYGGELKYDWMPLPWMRTFVGYAFTRVVLHPKPGQEAHQTDVDWINTSTPVETTSLGLFLDLPRRWKLDTVLYIVSDYPGISVQNYRRWDVRLAWSPHKNFEASLVGRNLGAALYKEHESISFLDASAIRQELFLNFTFKN